MKVVLKFLFSHDRHSMEQLDFMFPSYLYINCCAGLHYWSILGSSIYLYMEKLDIGLISLIFNVHKPWKFSKSPRIVMDNMDEDNTIVSTMK